MTFMVMKVKRTMISRFNGASLIGALPQTYNCTFRGAHTIDATMAFAFWMMNYQLIDPQTKPFNKPATAY